MLYVSKRAGNNMNDVVYVNEIKSCKVTWDTVDGVTTHKFKIYNLLLPHLSSKFRNKSDNNVAISCFPPFPYSVEVEDFFLNYIRNNIKDGDTNIFFDNVYEGHTTCCFNGIYGIVKKLNLNPNKCYFISGGMQANELHKEYIKNFNISEPINTIILNSWERHISLKFNDHKSKLFEPQHLIKNKDKLFLCFNRIVRAHRVALLGLLYDKNLVDNSYYSYFPNSTYSGITLGVEITRSWFNEADYTKIVNGIHNNKHKFPLLLNNHDASNTNELLADDKQYYDNSYFSLVTETFFFNDTNNTGLKWEERSVFFSEKIFKPIICKHPFILVSRPHSLKYLKKIGYKTFHPYINESYDDIEKDSDRLIAIVNEVERLSKQTPEEWITWLKNVEDIIEHNYNLIINKSRDDFEYNDSV